MPRFRSPLRRIALAAILVFVGQADAAGQLGRPSPPSGPVIETGSAVAWPHLPPGRRMASGGTYSPGDWVVAHRSLPLGLRLVLTDDRGERAVVVTVSDRGSHLASGAMLVSDAAAALLGIPEDEPRRVRFRRLRPGDPATPGAWTPDRAAEPAAGQEWSVQLGSFGERSAAERFAERLDGTRVERIRVDGRTVYRVYFGRFSDRTHAEAWRERLAGWGIDGFVKSLHEADR
jgi:rare lipoprotein A